MTMDINNLKPDIKTDIYVQRSDDRTELVGKSVKRPFDVAFLMLPDDKMKQKRLPKLIDYEAQEVDTPDIFSPQSVTPSIDTDDSDEEIEVGNHENVKLADFSKSKYISQKQQVFDDPNITKHQLKPTQDESRAKLGFHSSPDQKSAFTKVHMNKEARISPNLSISPDLSYQNSLSPSPPIINRNYQNFSNNFPMFKGQSVTTYPNNFMAESLNISTNAHHNQQQQQQQQQELDSHFHNINKASMVELIPQNFSKMRPMLGQFRPEQIHYNYQQRLHSHHHELLKMSQAQAAAAAVAAAGPDLSHQIRHPAAAILSSLLPPSLAALSLPAQNVCAKCNITFRMTSDLVYHMRSHHKNENTDYSRRKREDKLKCPVCAESFRERHHLTRHMTAHQDKDNDVLEPGMKKKAAYAVGFSK